MNTFGQIMLMATVSSDGAILRITSYEDAKKNIAAECP